MEGSGSGLGSGGFNRGGGGEGLLTPPRSSRRRTRGENPNCSNPEMFVQPQPQQGEADVQVESPADLRSRLANRRYSKTFRHKRQTQVQQLEAHVASLEARNAEEDMEYERQVAERTEIRTDMEALLRRREAAATNLRAIQAQTGRIKAKIERLEKKMVAEDQEMKNIMMYDPFYHFFEETFTSSIYAAAAPYHCNPPPPPPPGNPAPGDDEAGPSGANDSSNDPM